MRFACAADAEPEPSHVLGTALRPFCLGHHLWFGRLKLPFTEDPGADADEGQLLTAIAVCSQSYEDTAALTQEGRWQREFDGWLAQLRGPWWKRHKPNLGEAERVF